MENKIGNYAYVCSGCGEMIDPDIDACRSCRDHHCGEWVEADEDGLPLEGA